LKSDLLNQAQDYVRHLFEGNLQTENVYHNMLHTSEVVAAAGRIANAEGIKESDLELILIAAWFHDAGYVKTCEGHEEKSIEYAKNFLQLNNYPEARIQKVLALIAATKLPQNPKNHLEEVLCDADLHHLGTDEFLEKGRLVRLELEKKGELICTDEVWLETSIKFLNQHRFFTKYAEERYVNKKNINLLQIKKRLKQLNKKVSS